MTRPAVHNTVHNAVRALVFVAVPLAGLAALWASSDHLSRQGTDWEVPIQGYDPRDLLRGQYVQFRYQWPIAKDAASDDGPFIGNSSPQYLCLIGNSPIIAQAIAYDGPTDPGFDQCEHKLIAQHSSVYGYDSLSRGRLYVGQARAQLLEQGLGDFDQRAIVRFRQRADGVLTPLEIRFRPLEPAELEERSAARTQDASVTR